MPPPLSPCLPEELTEFEVVRGGRKSSGLCNSTLRVIDPSAKLSLPTPGGDPHRPLDRRPVKCRDATPSHPTAVHESYTNIGSRLRRGRDDRLHPHTGYVQGTDVRPAPVRETANVTTHVNHPLAAPPYRQTNPVWRDVGG